MKAAAELELKQRLASLSEKERRAMSAYLLRLKHQSPRGQREISRLMEEIDSGKKTDLASFAREQGHG